MTHVRDEIPAKYKWDLTGIYPTEADFEADYARAKACIADFSRHRDTMAKSAQGLYDALQASTALARASTNPYEFALPPSAPDHGMPSFLS